MKIGLQEASEIPSEDREASAHAVRSLEHPSSPPASPPSSASRRTFGYARPAFFASQSHRFRTSKGLERRLKVAMPRASSHDPGPIRNFAIGAPRRRIGHCGRNFVLAARRSNCPFRLPSSAHPTSHARGRTWPIPDTPPSPASRGLRWAGLRSSRRIGEADTCCSIVCSPRLLTEAARFPFEHNFG